MVNWDLIWHIYVKLFMLIMIDVKLTPIGLSVGCDVSSVCFCLSVFSKNDCNSEGDKQTQH